MFDLVALSWASGGPPLLGSPLASPDGRAVHLYKANTINAILSPTLSLFNA